MRDSKREDIFNNLAKDWDQKCSEDLNYPFNELLELCGIEGKTVADIGSGTGILFQYASKYKPAKWIAIDISEKMLQMLSVKYQSFVESKCIELCHADIHSLPISDNSIDTAICHNAFPHFQNRSKALSEIHRMLKPEGIFCINHFPGRKIINQIHSCAEDLELRNDKAEPNEILIEDLEKVGLKLNSLIDNDDNFRLLATAKK